MQRFQYIKFISGFCDKFKESATNSSDHTNLQQDCSIERTVARPIFATIYLEFRVMSESCNGYMNGELRNGDDWNWW